MKFATQHKKATGLNRQRPNDIFTIHKQGATVWVSSGDTGAILMSHTFQHVSQAGRWMCHPTLTPK